MAAASIWRARPAGNPETGFIGCEVFSGGIAKLLAGHRRREASRNIRLFTDDALKLLVKLPDASLDAAYLLYPDPWPKTPPPQAPLHLADDARRAGARAEAGRRSSTSPPISRIMPTGRWPTSCARRISASRPTRPGIWHEPYPGWQPTRYEEKARREGRMTSFYFEFHARLAAPGCTCQV